VLQLAASFNLRKNKKTYSEEEAKIRSQQMNETIHDLIQNSVLEFENKRIERDKVTMKNLGFKVGIIHINICYTARKI
jgi:hypothetical protein